MNLTTSPGKEGVSHVSETSVSLKRKPRQLLPISLGQECLHVADPSQLFAPISNQNPSCTEATSPLDPAQPSNPRPLLQAPPSLSVLSGIQYLGMCTLPGLDHESWDMFGLCCNRSQVRICAQGICPRKTPRVLGDFEQYPIHSPKIGVLSIFTLVGGWRGTSPGVTGVAVGVHIWVKVSQVGAGQEQP